jgi:hypothetical protein
VVRLYSSKFLFFSLWKYFLKIYSWQVYSVDKTWTTQRQKSLHLFLDAIDSYRDQPISFIFEELDQNHEEIFIVLLESAEMYLKAFVKDKDRYDEESVPTFEFLQKILFISEIFLNTESKLSVSKVFDLKPSMAR